jgi:GDPmannose 4,6-dehydratase
MKKALIFGISGQDGAYLARLLLEKGYEVHGTSRDHEISTFSNLVKLGIRDSVRLHSMTCSEFRSVLTTLQKVEADEVYNLSGQTSVALSFAYPVETFESISVGTINILESLRLLKHGSRFYSAGSSEVFGNTEAAATEMTPFRPRSPYATAKAAAHYSVANYREAYGLFACSGILFNHESPLRPARFVTRKIVSTAVRIANGSGERLVLGNLDVQRDWGWAPEYVDAMWRMMQRPRAEDFVIATGKSYRLSFFVETVFALVGLNWQDHVDVDESFFRPSDISVSSANPKRALELLDWQSQCAMPEIVRQLIAAESAS